MVTIGRFESNSRTLTHESNLREQQNVRGNSKAFLRRSSAFGGPRCTGRPGKGGNNRHKNAERVQDSAYPSVHRQRTGLEITKGRSTQ